MQVSTILIYVCVGAVIGIPVIAALVGVGITIYKQISSSRLRKLDVSAPAIVNSVAVGTITSFGTGGDSDRGDMRWRVNFDVTVQPQNEPPFHAEFMSLLRESQRDGIENEKKIWVRYDPNDHSKITFDETDSKKVSDKQNMDMVDAYSEHARLDSLYVPLRISGQRCQAVILHREKLVDVPPGSPVLYRFTLDVLPTSTAPYKAESQLIVADDRRFAVGNPVFVRFDPKDPSFVAIENF